MAEQDKFQVFVSDYTSSVEEWREAMTVPRAQLPPLSDQQSEVARKFGISDEEYARAVLAGQYGETRMKDRGQALGRAIQSILGGLGSDYRLVAVKAEMFNGRWVARITAPDKVANVAVPRELADDVLDSGVMEELEKLRVCLLTGLGRTEFIVPR